MNFIFKPLNYYESGCPSWIARRQGHQEGYSEGYGNAEAVAKEKIKKLVLKNISPTLKDEIEKELRDALKEEIEKEKEKILTKEREELEKELTLEITNKVYEKLRKEVDEYRTKIKTESNIIFLPNLKIIVDKMPNYKIKVEEYVGKKFEEMGYEVTYCMHYRNGHPDLICKKGLEVLYVEVKSSTDGLRLSQAKWILNNKDKQCLIYFLDGIRNENDEK